MVKFLEEQRLNAVKLYQEGKSISEVEDLTGISSSYIKNLLKKYNIQTRPSGFQKGNPSRKGKLHSIESKIKISENHKASGHKPNRDAIIKGQPLSLKKRWSNHKKDAAAHLFVNYKNGAKSRNLLFNLSREEFDNLISKNCYYCGDIPSLRIINNCSLICNGIDRVDNSLGYFQDNCVSACKICNVMKSSKDRDEFISHCLKIALRFQK